MNMIMDEIYKLELTKREFVLVTKALTGALKDKRGKGETETEIARAHALGVDMIEAARDRMTEKLDALARVQEQVDQR